jgi:hypothetical protein
MRLSSLLFVFLFFVLSCNQVIDPNPVDPGGEPAEAVQVVRKHFPNAKDMVFKVLMAGEIWEVGFKSDKDSYTSLVDETKMWETFRANPDSTPVLLNDLIRNTSFKDGSFSANSEDIDFYTQVERRNRLIYSLNAMDFVFDWRRYNGSNYRPTNANFEQIRYKIKISTIDGFPREIRDFFSANSNLAFIFGEVRIKLNYEKQFWFQVLFNRDGKDYMGYMLFDEKGVLKWVSREFNQPFPDNQVTNIDTLPEAIQKHLDNSPELANFKYYTSGLDKWRSEYKGVSSYFLVLRNRGYAEVCELYFDQDGNLLNKRYFVSF